MNAKIVALLERHLEKIVLAVAVAGAGFIAYSGMQPTTLPDGTTASGVEEKVSTAVEALEAASKRTTEVPETELTSSLKDYVAEYNNLMLRHPLSEALVSSDAVPRFAPIQASISGNEGGNTQLTGLRLKVPDVLPPKNVTAVADRGSVIPPPTDPAAFAAAAAASGAPAIQPVDKNWVCVSGYIPWKDYIDAYNALQANQKLAPENQRNVLYRIEVQRRTRTASGWSDWQTVPPSKAGGATIPDIDWNSLSDTELLTTVSNIDANFQRIAEPLFYFLAPKDPTLPPSPIIPAIAKTATTQPAPGAAPVRPGAGPLAPVPGHPGIPPAMMTRGNPNQPPAEFENPTPGLTPGQPIPGLTLDVNALKQQGNVPFWFWDDTVDAGHDYQYRARIVMYNPLYRYPNAPDLQNPNSAKDPTIASSWVAVPGTVTVTGDLAFFVEAPFGPPSQKVTFHVFKWTSGGWYEADWTRDTGEPVQGKIQIVDKQPPVWIDVNTGYTLVDVQNPSADLTAILLSPSGDLITHTASADSHANPDRAAKEAARVKAPGKPHVVPPPVTPGGTPLPVNRPVVPGPRTRNPANNPEEPRP